VARGAGVVQAKIQVDHEVLNELVDESLNRWAEWLKLDHLGGQAIGGV